MPTDIITKAADIIRQRTAQDSTAEQNTYCVLALFDANDFPTASVITAAKSDGIRKLYFDTGLASNKVQRINRNNRASVCFASWTYNITLVGTIEVLTDLGTKQAMWYPGMEDHFTGADDPEYCVLAFTTQSYNLFIDWKEAIGTIE